MTEQVAEITEYWERVMGRDVPAGPQLVSADQIVVDKKDVEAVIAALKARASQ